MRCNNCGWDNPSNAEKCEKCNAPLKGSMVKESQEESPVNDNKQNMKSTVKGAEPDKPPLDENIICPECRYPVTKKAEKCPSCGADLKNKKTPFGGTVSPWDTIDNNLSGKPVLIPLSKEGEKENDAIEITEDEVKLNRDNLESGNMTITSKTQAVIKKHEGKWYIQDKSELKTTFVLAKQRVELKKGDVILLGNRKFEFDV